MVAVDDGVKEHYRRAIQKASEIDFDIVKVRYMNKNLATRARANLVAAETVKYLCLAHSYKEHEWIITGDIDEFWHTFILFTERYAEFCNAVFGYFLHHVPGEEGRLRDRINKVVRKPSDSAEGYRRTLDLYREITGTEPSSQVWPAVSVLERGQDPMPCGACGGGGPPDPACGCSRPRGAGPPCNPVP
ncbi:glycine-rich domain-containing protein [Sphingopyxis sp. FD7]|jgi:hypothetical protein|uniref:glycine-rich domain-containing protein n=1 Tax=Sphingopyxis sp. FD7 TaxID=1914525 RepID=UPI000DC63EE5|nr:hypothetical protein [Sphingopyxis sp. FD7]BBB12053.1 hypothetical protein SPYCA_1311 [Sphingopyxis sp. FD7]